jgi:hypothetical protein
MLEHGWKGNLQDTRDKNQTNIGKKIPNTWQHLEQKSESKLSFIFFRDHATP